MPAKAAAIIPPTMKVRDMMTVFKGWGTAYFPTGIELLQGVVHEPYATREWLDAAACRVGGFPLKGVEDEPKTFDDLGGEVIWEVGYYFDLPRGGQAVVLIPKTNTNHFCAVYARGPGFSDIDVLGRIVISLFHAIED